MEPRDLPRLLLYAAILVLAIGLIAGIWWAVVHYVEPI